MTQLEFAELAFQYLFIYFIETGFLVIMTSILMKEDVDFTKLVPTIIILSVISQVILNLEQGGILNRVLYLMFLSLYIINRNRYSFKEMLSYLKCLLSSTLIMMVCEALGFIPFLFILGDEMQTLSSNIFILIALSIPTRMFEYIVLYVFYLRKVGLHVKKSN